MMTFRITGKDGASLGESSESLEELELAGGAMIDLVDVDEETGEPLGEGHTLGEQTAMIKEHFEEHSQPCFGVVKFYDAPNAVVFRLGNAGDAMALSAHATTFLEAAGADSDVAGVPEKLEEFVDRLGKAASGEEY